MKLSPLLLLSSLVLRCGGGTAESAAASDGSVVDSDARDSAVTPPPPGYVRIPAGTFEMGSPEDEVGRQLRETQRMITLTRDVWMKTTEVTQDEWVRLMGSNPSRFSSCGGQCPVEMVSWWEAMAFCNALSVKEGLTPCYAVTGCSGTTAPNDGCASLTWTDGLDCEGYRLPTEAEWEYAARAGTTGPQYGPLLDIAWFSDNSGSETHPVGLKLPNAFGVYDMLGNVWEWCWDWYGDVFPLPATDPMGPSAGQEKTFRGGSWFFNAIFMRAANRNHNDIGHRGMHLGFRTARTAR